MTANNDSISGKDPEDIMKKILSKLVGIKKSMIGKYQEIKKKSQYDNTTRTLDEVISS